jgi:hypothetical protein
VEIGAQPTRLGVTDPGQTSGAGSVVDGAEPVETGAPGTTSAPRGPTHQRMESTMRLAPRHINDRHTLARLYMQLSLNLTSEHAASNQQVNKLVAE